MLVADAAATAAAIAAPPHRTPTPPHRPHRAARTPTPRPAARPLGSLLGQSAGGALGGANAAYISPTSRLYLAYISPQVKRRDKLLSLPFESFLEALARLTLVKPKPTASQVRVSVRGRVGVRLGAASPCSLSSGQCPPRRKHEGYSK